jgi:4-oxalocrotonate tautomerase
MTHEKTEQPMPIVRVEILEGRSQERKAELIRRLSEAVVESLEVRPEQVRVLLYELPAEHWAVGGETMAARRAADDRRGGAQ